MPISNSTKLKFNAICYEYNNNENMNMVYNMIVELLTTCNPDDLANNDSINELNHIINRFTSKNDNNLTYNIEAIIEDFLNGEKYKVLRMEFC